MYSRLKMCVTRTMQPKEDLEIVVNAPAISMEEVLPIAVSTHTQLAPEEVLAKGRREKKGDTELTDVCFLCLCCAMDVVDICVSAVLWMWFDTCVSAVICCFSSLLDLLTLTRRHGGRYRYIDTYIRSPPVLSMALA